jgi:hypothetical protein
MTGDNIVGSKRQIVWWHGIFIDRMTDGVIDGIILLIILSVIFKLWHENRLSSPPPPFLILLYVFFFATTNHLSLSLPNLNIIQPLTTNLATTILNLSASVFWFKFYWGFSTLSKQIYFFFIKLNFKMLIFFLYIFCSICVLFGCLLVL